MKQFTATIVPVVLAALVANCGIDHDDGDQGRAGGRGDPDSGGPNAGGSVARGGAGGSSAGPSGSGGSSMEGGTTFRPFCINGHLNCLTGTTRC